MAAEESAYVLWHDAGELLTGDHPGMIKTEAPELKPVLDRLEQKAVAGMGGPRLAMANERTKLRTKVCDLIDVLEFGLTETLQGNRLAEPIVSWAALELEKRYGLLTRADFEAVMAYIAPMEDWYKR